MAVNFRTLDLNLLRVFDEIMAERSLTRAADNLAMTQPAVSNALRRLREALGDELLVRSGRGVEPTHQALLLWPAVREALDRIRDAMVPPGFDATVAEQSFDIAMADATAALLIPPLVAAIGEQAPGVSLHARPLVTRDPREILAQGTVDLAVGFFPRVISEVARDGLVDGVPSPVVFEPLYEGRYVCVMRRDHPLAASPMTLDEYCAARHLLVSFSGSPFGFIDQALASLKRKRRIVVTVNQFFTAGQVVANSDLLTVLAEHFVPSTGLGEALAIRPLPFEVPRVRIDMLWHRRNQERPDHQWLRRQVSLASGTGFARMRAEAPRQSLGWMSGQG